MGKVYCEGCQKRCRGNVLRVIDKFFHKDCFRCSECKCSLETGGFFIRNSKYYCQKDHEKIFVSKCKVCDQPLSDNVVSALSFSFHKQCFKCTGCSSPFQPGDQVTVWKEQFLCATCSSAWTPEASRPTQKHRLSFADQLVSPSPETDSIGNLSGVTQAPVMSPSSAADSCGGGGGGGAQRLPTEKTNGTAKTKILKSSLRHSTTSPTLAPSQNFKKTVSDQSTANASLDVDSVVTGRLLSPMPQQNGSATLPAEGLGDSKRSVAHNLTPRSRTFSPDLSKSSTQTGRHPLSEYGRFYNLSYMSISEHPSGRSTDQYRRSATLTPSVSNSLHHFHIPEGHSRFTLPQNRFRRSGHSFNSSLRDALLGADELVIRKAPNAGHASRLNTTDTMDDVRRGPTMCSSPQLAGVRPITSTPSPHAPPIITTPSTNDDAGRETDTAADPTVYRGDREASLEARRLASYPAGQPRDESTPSAIERYDWPAPASSAVVLAELMRERRHRRREQARLSGSRDDADSQEDLSIDASIESPSDLAQSSGIGRAIQLEEKRRTVRSHQPLDPVSASRTPNASSEPPFKTRYATHSFACNSSIVRPGYTAGHLTAPSMTCSLPVGAGASFLSTGGRLNYTDTIDEEKPNNVDGTAAEPRQENGLHLSNGYGLTQSQYSPQRTTRPSFRVNGAGGDGEQDLGHIIGSSPSYPSVLYASTPSAVFKQVPPPPVREVAYKDLTSGGGQWPKGLDKTKLEVKHFT
ncbi:Actin-binding LIM protein 3 [Sparganum proliferum]